MLSGLILIGRKFDQESPWGREDWREASKREFGKHLSSLSSYLVLRVRGRERAGSARKKNPVIKMEGKHLYPCRTQQLSPQMQTIVRWRRLVKICNCRVQAPSLMARFFFVPKIFNIHGWIMSIINQPIDSILYFSAFVVILSHWAFILSERDNVAWTSILRIRQKYLIKTQFPFLPWIILI